MKKMTLKRAACAALLSCTLLSASLPAAFAAKIPFDITNPGDTLTRKVLKNTDGDQYFYVTPFYFSNRGTLNCLSTNYLDHSIYSYSVTIDSSDINRTASARYRTYAPGDQNYFMSGTSTVSLNVSGDYTP